MSLKVLTQLTNKKKLKSKVRSNHFAGQIVNLDDNGVEISFLKNSGKFFMQPDPLSVSWVDVNDIHLKVDTPNMDRRQHLMFDDNDIEKNGKFLL